jgi:pyrimidine-nucleoside phosphorylase
LYGFLYWSWQLRQAAFAAVMSPARAARAPSSAIDAQFEYSAGPSFAMRSMTCASAGRSPAETGGLAFFFIHAWSGQSGRGFFPHSGASLSALASFEASLVAGAGDVRGAAVTGGGAAREGAGSSAVAAAAASVVVPPVGTEPVTVLTGALASPPVGVIMPLGGVGPDSTCSPGDFEQASTSARVPTAAAYGSGRIAGQLTRRLAPRGRTRAPRLAVFGYPASMERTLVELLAAKRDGESLPAEEIGHLVGSFVDGTLADYQMAAFLMAVFFRGLDDAETVALTEAMLRSGLVLDLSAVSGTKVDKHSTGGVGDKISICLAPLVAACGVPVPMVSGRGLGHTGGTLDKLEAIPGFRTDLSTEDFARIVKDIGACMIGQTRDIAPADKRMYALRDVTATVESIPLIVASILSKKLAEGIDGLVLDVKVGRGAFMKDEPRARALAEKLVRVGTRAGKKVVAVLTRMDVPLGEAIGNASETREALEVLHGKGPEDVVECTLVLGAEMLVLGGQAKDVAEGRAKLRDAISSGKGVRLMERMVSAQGGDASVVADPSKLEMAREIVEVKAPRSGFVAGIDALSVGLAGVAMGAGRTRADQPVDPGVGIQLDRKPGARVEAGDVVARLFVREARAGEAVLARVAGAFSYADAPPPAPPLVVDRIVQEAP